MNPYIDPRLEYTLRVTREIDHVLYYKSPTKAVLKAMHNDAMDRPVIISIEDTSIDGIMNEKRVKNIIIDKLRNFGFLNDNNCTAMSLGHIGLFSFANGPSIRMDVKEIDSDFQTGVDVATKDDLKVIDNQYIRNIVTFINEVFDISEGRFDLTIPLQDNSEVFKIYLWYWIDNAGTPAKNKIFKITLSQTNSR